MVRLSGLSTAELEHRLAHCHSETDDPLLHELQIHEIELELQNRELRRTQLQVENSRDRYVKLYDAAPIGYIRLDSKGIIKGVNLAATELLRRARPFIVGYPMMSFIAASSVPVWCAHIRQWRSGATVVDEIDLLSSDQRHLPVQIVSVNVGPDLEFEQDGPVYLLAIIDIGDRKRAESALNRAHAELELRVKQRTLELETVNTALQGEIERGRQLEEALRERAGQLKGSNDRKDEFLAMLSHELRNPLAALQIGFELIKRQQAPEADEGPPLHGMMDRQFKQLVRLTDDLLDLSRINSGRIRLQTEALDLRAVIDDTILAAAAPLEDRHHELSTVVPDKPVRVVGDSARLHQLVLNLLLNAIKFTDPGGRLGLTLLAEKGYAVLKVSDNGPGIAPELQPHIFEPFVQGESSIARSKGGLGLGLALVQRIAQLHGGQAEVFSAGEGLGSEFTVRLPMTKSVPVPRRSAGKAARKGSKHRLRILLVDDNEDFTKTVAILLRGWGHEVEVANDGRDAIQVARRFGPELAFIDIGLPIMDGYAVASALRRQKETRQAALVALSGYGGAEFRERAVRAEFSDYLTKPLVAETLQAFVAKWAERRVEAPTAPDGDSPASGR